MRLAWIRSLGWEDSLEEGMATHSSILAWRIPMDRGAWWLGARSPWGHNELDTTEQLSKHSPAKGAIGQGQGERRFQAIRTSISRALSMAHTLF